MKHIKPFFTVLICLLVLLSSCSDNSNLKKKVTGKAGEMVIVIPKETWEGPVGEEMRKVLAQPQLFLPQEEPIFDLISVPPVAFKDIFNSNRSILNVRISPNTDTTKVEFKKDIWAWPQSVVNIQAKSSDEFIDLFKQNSDKIVAYMLKGERERLLTNYEKYSDKAIRAAIEKKFNIEITLPVGFKIANQGTDYMWLRYDTPDIMQGIAIYAFPYTSDSTFTNHYLVEKRDSLSKIYVGGPTAGSYMTTERLIEPGYSVFTFNNNYASEMRGLWRVEGDFMGGPFLSLAVLDASNNRVVVAEGFVYAPRFDKRNYLRQVEAMIYSIKLPDQAKNDKINSQINMGN
ncbi:MAG: DUF4837 family protein [Mangrovibacterium sp.]